MTDFSLSLDIKSSAVTTGNVCLQDTSFATCTEVNYPQENINYSMESNLLTYKKNHFYIEYETING